MTIVYHAEPPLRRNQFRDLAEVTISIIARCREKKAERRRVRELMRQSGKTLTAVARDAH